MLKEGTKGLVFVLNTVTGQATSSSCACCLLHQFTPPLVYLDYKLSGSGSVSVPLCSVEFTHSLVLSTGFSLALPSKLEKVFVLQRMFIILFHQISFVRSIFMSALLKKHGQKFPLLWLSFVLLPERCHWSSFTSSSTPNTVPALSFRCADPYSFSNQGARSCISLSVFMEKVQVRFMHCQAALYFVEAPAVSAIVFYKTPWLFLRFFLNNVIDSQDFTV